MPRKKKSSTNAKLSVDAQESKNANEQNSKDGDKEKEKVITGKDLVITFIVFFLVFGVVGYMRGRAEKYEPSRLRFDIGKQLQLRTENGKRQISYQCSDGGSVWWYVDENDLHNTMTGGNSSEIFDSSPAIFSNEVLTTAFVTGGGAASIFTVRELFTYAAAGGKGNKLLNEGHIKLIVVAVLATIAGYEVGRSLALWKSPNCSDSRLGEFLKNQENWRWFEEYVWDIQFESIARTDHLQECKINDLQKKDETEKKLVFARNDFENHKNGDVTRTGHDFISADFDALEKYKNAIDEFNKSCEN